MRQTAPTRKGTPEFPRASLPFDGGAGNRTLVRISVQRSAYVRRPPSSRGPGPVSGRPSRSGPPEISPVAPEDSRRASPDFGPDGAPQAGSFIRWCVSELSSTYAASAKSELAVEMSQTVFPGIWTWARSHTFYRPVEASRPRPIKSKQPGTPPQPAGAARRSWRLQRAIRGQDRGLIRLNVTSPQANVIVKIQQDKLLVNNML